MADLISNETGYHRYRNVIEASRTNASRYGLVSMRTSEGLHLATQDWTYRYLRRFIAIEGNRSYPSRLADVPSANALRARYSFRDGQYPDVPPWPEIIFSLNISLSIDAENDWNGRPPLLETIHSHGPSIRQLWTKAKADGASDEAAWESVRAWANQRPLDWGPEGQSDTNKKMNYDRALSNRLQEKVVWTSTTELDHPWSAEIGGQQWRVGVNDYPDEYMYRLLVDDQTVGDFHDWPIVWIRPEGPGWVEVKRPTKPARMVAPTGMVAERLPERYLHGEHEAVWADLMRLGPAVRKEPYLEPALRVTREMVRRSRINLITLFGRLDELGYEFWSSQARQLIRLSKPERDEPWKQPEIWEPPTKKSVTTLAQAEKRGVTLPLAVRVWAEEIGDVSFVGSHPVVCPFYSERDHPSVYADPLMVGPIVRLMSTSKREMDGDGESLFISFTDMDKAELPLGDEQDFDYSVTYPNAMADAKLEGIWYETTFVGYLRKSFQWGGFPGWERYQERPERELAFLREGLLPI